MEELGRLGVEDQGHFREMQAMWKTESPGQGLAGPSPSPCSEAALTRVIKLSPVHQG